MNTSVNELLSNPAFRPLVLLDVLAVFLMIICLVFRRNPYRLLSVGRHVGWLTETSGLLPPPLEGVSGVPVRPTLQGW